MGRNTNQVLLAIMLDILSLAAAVFLAAWLRVTLPWGRFLPEVTQEIPLLVEAILIYPISYALASLYDPDRRLHEWDEFLALITASCLGGLALAGLIYFTIREISRLWLVYFYVIQFTLVIAWRQLVQWWVYRQPAHEKNFRRMLLVGTAASAGRVIDGLAGASYKDFSLVGFLEAGGDGTANSLPGGLACLGQHDQIRRVVVDHKIEDVLIALPASSDGLISQIVTCLTDTPCNIWIIPDIVNLLIYGGKFQSLGDLSMISLKAPTLTGYQRMLKRIFDLVLGSFLLLFFAPLMLVIALLVKLDSPGPILLKQQRVGENRRLFDMYKFRTMQKDASEQLPGSESSADLARLQHKHPFDPRITRLGRILRRTSLDELPQLWNVLKGEMSLVGPRPELPSLVALYQPWQQKRFAVPQGMTGWWQVNGRSDRPMFLNTEDDLFYVQNYSLFLDLQILLKTLWVVLRGKGAY